MASVKVHLGSTPFVHEADDLTIVVIAGAYSQPVAARFPHLFVQFEGRKVNHYFAIPADALVEFEHDSQVDMDEGNRLLEEARPTIQKFGGIGFTSDGEILPLP